MLELIGDHPVELGLILLCAYAFTIPRIGEWANSRTAQRALDLAPGFKRSSEIDRTCPTCGQAVRLA